MPQHGLGRVFKEDVRDRAYPMRAVMRPLTLQDLHSVTWAVPKARDQGQTSECTCYSSTGLLLSAPIRQSNIPNTTLLYNHARLTDEFPDNDNDPEGGTTVRAVMAILKEIGYIAEYRWGTTANDVIDWLIQHSPVVVGTTWHNDMFNPLPSGLVHPTGAVAGGHAYLCYRYDHRRGLLWFLNSWGTDWGVKGRFCMQVEEFDKLLHDQGEACTAIEQRLKGKLDAQYIQTGPASISLPAGAVVR
jgi:hypothetical protein